jgi:hypothetical protein
VDNAYRLQGKALIIVGEMDSNVEPASSWSWNLLSSGFRRFFCALAPALPPALLLSLGHAF